MKKPKTKNVQYAYFHDPITPRTVTVARMLIDDKLYMSWSVNKMVRDQVAYAKDGFEPNWYGDIFNKKIGRDVAAGRLFTCEFPVVVDPSKPKIKQVVEYMMKHSPKSIQNIVKRSVKEKYPDSEL